MLFCCTAATPVRLSDDHETMATAALASRSIAPMLERFVPPLPSMTGCDRLKVFVGVQRERIGTRLFHTIEGKDGQYFALLQFSDNRFCVLFAKDLRWHDYHKMQVIRVFFVGVAGPEWA